MSGERKPVIKKLSQGVLDLKFMKKSKEKVRIEEENEERQILYQDQLAALQNSGDSIVKIGSHYDLMKYLPCRLSFGGMEPNIEKLNADKLTGLYEQLEKDEDVQTKEEDVSTEEMVSYYQTCKQTWNKKFQSKRSGHEQSNQPHKRKKNNFIKDES